MENLSAAVKFTSQTIARDKLTRALQYASKLIGYISEQKKINPDLLARIKKLEYTLSTSRKTFRLGKSLDMLLGGIRGSQIQDPLIRICVVVARISRCVYFLYDVLNWCCRVTLMKGNAKDYATRAAPFWFVAVLFCLLRDAYEIMNYVMRAKAKNKEANLQDCISSRPDIVVDTLKNASDFLIPLKLWGKVDLSQGTVGLLGLISSICGILTIAKPKYKLSPM